jgi:phytoene dehydrogenase-like protein
VALLKVDVALSGLPVFDRYGGKPEQTLATSCIAPSMTYIEEAFDDIMHGHPSRKPALWCAVASHLDPTLAPPGKHTLWLSQFAPARLSDGRSWDEARDEVADNMIATWCQYAPNTRDLTIDRHISSPLDWERRTGNLNGSAFHVAMTVNQLWGFRPTPALSRYRTPIQGLYLSGSGSHPGGGVTGLPGRNTAMEVLADLGHKPPRKGMIASGKEMLRMYRAFRELQV